MSDAEEKSELTKLLSSIAEQGEEGGEVQSLAKLALRKVNELETQVLDLQAENENLWFMLDDLKEAQQWTKEHTQELQRSINDHLAMYKMMQNNKGEA